MASAGARASRRVAPFVNQRVRKTGLSGAKFMIIYLYDHISCHIFSNFFRLLIFCKFFMVAKKINFKPLNIFFLIFYIRKVFYAHSENNTHKVLISSDIIINQSTYQVFIWHLIGPVQRLSQSNCLHYRNKEKGR